MTKIFDDPADFADDQLSGFLDLYADRLRGVPGGVVTHRTDAAEPKVAVVIGGGSGHYPAFCGTVGPGLATGAVVGNIFTSPSAAQAYSVGRGADQGRGVIFSFGNYAGDNMNFGIAADRLRAAGVDTRIVVVTDDVASAPEESKRRGIAGDFTVFKVMGAAAEEGLDIDEVERLGAAANAATRTLGVAFGGCTMPGAATPLFSVPEGHLGLGLGIHGEPGISDIPMLSARELAELLVSRVLEAAPTTGPAASSKRIGVVVNGLGTTKYEELFLLWGHVSRLLGEAGYQVLDPEVGELVTSLDMGGCSLTVMWLDEELERLWRADAYTPAYRKQRAPVAALRQPNAEDLADAQAVATAPTATPAAQAFGREVRSALDVMRATLHENETELGRIDAVAGDGDHGRGMVKGIDAAVERVAAGSEDAGGAWLLQQAGQAWAERAGGTSGVLWGAALESFGRTVGDDADDYGASTIGSGARAFLDAMTSLGGAKIGDKTLLDALIPFVESLESSISAGYALSEAWSAAAEIATLSARNTAQLRPQVGRARPLAEKSVGTPDAGATSMALLVTALGEWLTNGAAHHDEEDA